MAGIRSIRASPCKRELRLQTHNSQANPGPHRSHLKNMNEPPNEHSVQRIWNDLWAINAPEIAVTLKDRFTPEAFRELRNFANPSDTSILDVGCGTGRFSALFAKAMPQCEVTGIDFAGVLSTFHSG